MAAILSITHILVWRDANTKTLTIVLSLRSYYLPHPSQSFYLTIG
jgi:hypothetical protein